MFARNCWYDTSRLLLTRPGTHVSDVVFLQREGFIIVVFFFGVCWCRASGHDSIASATPHRSSRPVTLHDLSMTDVNPHDDGVGVGAGAGSAAVALGRSLAAAASAHSASAHAAHSAASLRQSDGSGRTGYNAPSIPVTNAAPPTVYTGATPARAATAPHDPQQPQYAPSLPRAPMATTAVPSAHASYVPAPAHPAHPAHGAQGAQGANGVPLASQTPYHYWRYGATLGATTGAAPVGNATRLPPQQPPSVPQAQRHIGASADRLEHASQPHYHYGQPQAHTAPYQGRSGYPPTAGTQPPYHVSGGTGSVGSGSSTGAAPRSLAMAAATDARALPGALRHAPTAHDGGAVVPGKPSLSVSTSVSELGIDDGAGASDGAVVGVSPSTPAQHSRTTGGSGGMGHPPHSLDSLARLSVYVLQSGAGARPGAPVTLSDRGQEQDGGRAAVDVASTAAVASLFSSSAAIEPTVMTTAETASVSTLASGGPSAASSRASTPTSFSQQGLARLQTQVQQHHHQSLQQQQQQQQQGPPDAQHGAVSVNVQSNVASVVVVPAAGAAPTAGGRGGGRGP